MKFSVITPVKNSEAFIAETIESVINQHGNFEIEYLIIDGGSEDNTLKICKEYECQFINLSRKIFCNSIEFKVVSRSDNGVYEALADGLKLATGDITCYINSDDFYLPNAFNCLNEIFSKYPEVNWLTGIPVRYNENGHIINFFFPWQYNIGLILKGFNSKNLSFIQQESVFWRTELNKTIDFKELKNYKLAGDYFLWHSFAKQRIQLFIVDSFLGGNRLRKGQLSENKKEYYKELNLIKSKANIFDFVQVFFCWLMEKYAGKPVKRRLSKNRISFKNGNWTLK